jgi:hypothetical protein
MSEIKVLFFKYSPWFVLLLAFWVILKQKDWNTKIIKPIKYYLILAVLTQALSLYLWSLGKNNLPILHGYTILEFVVIIWLYKIVILEKISEKLFILLLISFIVFSILDSIMIESMYSFNTYCRSIEALIFVLLSMIWFTNRLSKNVSEEFTINNGVDYIIGGFFIYFSGSIVLFSFSNYINNLTYSLALNIWSFHTMLLLLMYILITVGLYKCRIK